MIVQANDNRGINTRTTNVSVTVNIIRNSSPFFFNQPCQFTISEKSELSVSLYRIQASDSDLIGAIVYTVQGDALAPGYFTVNSVSGVITAIADLRVDRTLIYTVCITSAVFRAAFSDINYSFFKVGHPGNAVSKSYSLMKDLKPFITRTSSLDL